MMRGIRKSGVKTSERDDSVMYCCILLGRCDIPTGSVCVVVPVAQLKMKTFDHVEKYRRRNGKSLHYPNNKRSTNFTVLYGCILNHSIAFVHVPPTTKSRQMIIRRATCASFFSFFCSTIEWRCIQMKCVIL